FKCDWSSDVCSSDLLSTHLHLSSPAAAMFFENKFNPSSLVTWLITLLLIICPSSYKARPDNLIGLYSFWSGIIPPQRSNARPNFPTSNIVGGAKFVWYPGYNRTGRPD